MDIAYLPLPRFDFDRLVRVAEEQTAQRLFASLPLGSSYAARLVPALATGLLVATVESVCIAEMLPRITDEQTVVGVEVDVHHLGPALAGRELRIRGTGAWRHDRTAAFEVVVEDDARAKVATAHVVMAVVDAARFAAGLGRRRERAPALAA